MICHKNFNPKIKIPNYGIIEYQSVLKYGRFQQLSCFPDNGVMASVVAAGIPI